MAENSDSPEVVREQVESAASNNVATIANGPGFFTNHLFNLANNSASAFAQSHLAISGKVSESIINTSVSEAGGTLLAMGMMIKNNQSTPPLSSGQKVPNQGE